MTDTTAGFDKHNSMILIVDDTQQNIQVLGSILMKENYQISVARNGLEALSAVEEVKPDILLLDIMMPELDGFETCKRLKESPDTKDIPIIFLTAKIETDDIIKGFELGAVDYITKPFNAKELLVRVNTHLDLKHSHESLRLKEQQLREAIAAKDRFFSIVHHDLKDPFNILIGFSQLLLLNYDKYEEEKIKEIVQHIFDSTKQASNLLENLVQWARSQTGQIQWSPCKIDIRNIVKENIEILNDTALKKNVRLHSEIKKPSFVYADENMINIIVRNLISNGLKYTPDGGEVRISARDSDEFVELIISDTGIGMGKDDIEKLFRIDVHYTTRGTSEETGTGLGLILCKKFIEKNGGKIRVESTLGKGSRFMCTLPKQEGD